MIREESFTMLSADCKYQKITHYTFQGQIHNGTDPLRDKEVKGPPKTPSPPSIIPRIVQSGSFDLKLLWLLLNNNTQVYFQVYLI